MGTSLDSTVKLHMFGRAECSYDFVKITSVTIQEIIKTLLFACRISKLFLSLVPNSLQTAILLTYRRGYSLYLGNSGIEK